MSRHPILDIELPTRVTTDSYEAPFVRILLDGVQPRGCIEADAAAGYIVCYKQPIEKDGEGLATERFEGVVTLEWIGT